MNQRLACRLLGQCDRCGEPTRSVQTFAGSPPETIVQHIHTRSLCDAVRSGIEMNALDAVFALTRRGAGSWTRQVERLDMSINYELALRLP